MSEPLQRQDTAFIDCVRTRRSPLADANCALAVVRVMEAATASLRNHGHAAPVLRS